MAIAVARVTRNLSVRQAAPKAGFNRERIQQANTIIAFAPSASGRSAPARTTGRLPEAASTAPGKSSRRWCRQILRRYLRSISPTYS
jgi:hypothetical protein